MLTSCRIFNTALPINSELDPSEKEKKLKRKYLILKYQNPTTAAYSPPLGHERYLNNSAKMCTLTLFAYLVLY